MPFGNPGKWILLTEQLASWRQDNLYSIHHLYYSRPSFSLHFIVALRSSTCVCEGACSEAVCMSVKNSIELGPRGTCEVFNVVKQVQPDRKGSPARASRLVTLWPSHHRAGTAVGGDVQIALSFSFSPPILSLCLSSAFPQSLTHTYAHTITHTNTVSQVIHYFADVVLLFSHAIL